MTKNRALNVAIQEALAQSINILTKDMVRSHPDYIVMSVHDDTLILKRKPRTGLSPCAVPLAVPVQTPASGFNLKTRSHQ